MLPFGDGARSRILLDRSLGGAPTLMRQATRVAAPRESRRPPNDILVAQER